MSPPIGGEILATTRTRSVPVPPAEHGGRGLPGCLTQGGLSLGPKLLSQSLPLKHLVEDVEMRSEDQDQD